MSVILYYYNFRQSSLQIETIQNILFLDEVFRKHTAAHGAAAYGAAALLANSVPVIKVIDDLKYRSSQKKYANLELQIILL